MCLVPVLKATGSNLKVAKTKVYSIVYVNMCKYMHCTPGDSV